ncbi:hypothetical protein AAC387_Pa05g1447 [Persea americana]
MGRTKIPIKLIECQKSRNSTFIKRIKGLKKKAFEFATLCDVDVCLICLGPQGERCYKPEIWPNEQSEVRRIIKRYRSLSKDEQVKKKLDLSGFLEQRTKKLEVELKLRSREKENVMYPSWDDRLNEFPPEMLQDLLATLDSKMEAANRKIELMKYKHSSQGNELSVVVPLQTDPNQGLLEMYRMLDGDDSMVPISYLKPLDLGHLPLELPYIPDTPNYSSSRNFNASNDNMLSPPTMEYSGNPGMRTLDFNTSNNNMLAPPTLGYYDNQGMRTLDTNMFQSQNELCGAECLRCLMQTQSSLIGSPSSPNSNSGSVHELLVHQMHHMNHGFSEFQMIQSKSGRY